MLFTITEVVKMDKKREAEETIKKVRLYMG